MSQTAYERAETCDHEGAPLVHLFDDETSCAVEFDVYGTGAELAHDFTSPVSIEGVKSLTGALSGDAVRAIFPQHVVDHACHLVLAGALSGWFRDHQARRCYSFAVR